MLPLFSIDWCQSTQDIAIQMKSTVQKMSMYKDDVSILINCRVSESSLILTVHSLAMISLYFNQPHKVTPLPAAFDLYL